MEVNKWMSNFYQHYWYEIRSSNNIELNQEGLYEWRISPTDFNSLGRASELGFELVETMVEFLSPVSVRNAEYPNIRMAQEKDLTTILKITYQTYILNKRFYSRFKNPNYFTEEQASKYYELSVINYFNNPLCLTAVVVNKEKDVIGYYMLLDTGSDNIYRGIMTGVLPEGIGKGLHVKMQRYLFTKVRDRSLILNKTQLNNLNTINNHIKERRLLKKIEHIYYKKVLLA